MAEERTYTLTSEQCLWLDGGYPTSERILPQPDEEPTDYRTRALLWLEQGRAVARLLDRAQVGRDEPATPARFARQLADEMDEWAVLCDDWENERTLYAILDRTTRANAADAGRLHARYARHSYLSDHRRRIRDRTQTIADLGEMLDRSESALTLLSYWHERVDRLRYRDMIDAAKYLCGYRTPDERRRDAGEPVDDLLF